MSEPSTPPSASSAPLAPGGQRGQPIDRRMAVLRAASQASELDDEFEALLQAQGAAKLQRHALPQTGDEVTGRVVRVGERSAEVALDEPFAGVEALLDFAEIAQRPAVGDRFRGHVIRHRHRVVEVATGMGRGALDLSALHDAARSGLPVEGKVVEVNKGGLVVEVGPARGFCPLGQMDVRRIEDPSAFVGQKLLFAVTEMREGKQPVLSRRRVLEAEAAQRAAETRERLVAGVRLRGNVVNIRDFGVFVDVGGVQGLVPRSELGYGRKHPSEVVQMGQAVEVEVMRWEPESDGDKGRLSLSMRALTEDPFEAAARELPEGAVCRGVVERIQPYGAFVSLASGVEGMLHVSAFGKRIGSPHDMVQDGDRVLVRVRSIDGVTRRIALALVDPSKLGEIIDPSVPVGGNSLGIDVLGVALDQGDRDEAGEAGAVRPHAPAKAALPAAGAMVQGTVDRHLRFGLLVGLNGGHEGFVPYAEIDLNSQQEARRKFPAGTTLSLVVLDVREDGRIRLSARQAAEQRERETAQHWLQAQTSQSKPASAEQVGSFGALLKEKLGL